MALKASPADQALLLELQAFDTKLSQLDHRAKGLPELAALAALKTQGDALRLVRSEQAGGLDDVKLELSRVDSDVKVVEARIVRDTDRLQASSSVKDVAALEQELTALKKRLDDLEEIELSVMEKLEERQAALDATVAAQNALTVQVTEVESTLGSSAGDIAAERSVAAAGRDGIAARVPVDLLALYEKQRSRYGTGASLLRGGVSLASGVKLLENEMQEIRAAAPDDIIMCASSEAILVRTDESGL